MKKRVVHYDKEKGVLTLGNGILTRRLDITSGCATVSYEYCERQEDLVSADADSVEAVVRLDGVDHSAGGKDSSFVYDSRSVDEREDGGACLNVFLRGDGSRLSRDIRLGLHYELGGEAHYLVKWISLENTGEGEVMLDSATPEALCMPMPKGVLRTVQPTQFQKYTMQFSQLNTARFRYCDKNLATRANSPLFFLDRHSREFTTGFSVLTDYVNVLEWTAPNCNLGGAVVESNGRDWPPTVVSRYGLGPGVGVTLGKPFVSFKTYECFFAGGYDDACLSFKKMLRNLCPWLGETYISAGSGKQPQSVNGYKEVIDRFARLGCETIAFVRLFYPRQDGHFTFNSEFFPGGLREARALVDYARQKGLKTTCYVPMMWALWHMDDTDLFEKNKWCLEMENGEGWYEGRFEGAAPRHIAACLASGYGEYVTQKLKDIVRDLGVDGLDTDGPHDGFVCYSKDHHHRSVVDSQYMQWEVQRKFYEEMAGAGIRIGSPQALCAILHGNTGTCCGFECWMPPESEAKEMDRMVSVWEQVVTARQDLWFTSFVLPPSAMWHSLSSWDYTGEVDERVMDHWFATVLGYGMGHVSLALTERTEPIFQRWFDFFRKYRAILESDIVHLYPPTGIGLDAIMHVNRDLDPCGFIMIYNPTSMRIRQTVSFPCKYFGAAAGLALIDRDGARTVPVVAEDALAMGLMEGERGFGEQACIDVDVASHEICWYEVRVR